MTKLLTWNSDIVPDQFLFSQPLRNDQDFSKQLKVYRFYEVELKAHKALLGVAALFCLSAVSVGATSIALYGMGSSSLGLITFGIFGGAVALVYVFILQDLTSKATATSRQLARQVIQKEEEWRSQLTKEEDVTCLEIISAQARRVLLPQDNLLVNVTELPKE